VLRSELAASTAVTSNDNPSARTSKNNRLGRLRPDCLRVPLKIQYKRWVPRSGPPHTAAFLKDRKKDGDIIGGMDALPTQLAILKEFYSGLAFRLQLFTEMQARLNAQIASRFNVFDYIEPDENKLTWIIADLLDPNGSHGQGTVFLDAFLEAVGHAKLSARSAGARVNCQEFSDSDTRVGFVDCTIELGDFSVGLENKPWAVEQKDQLRRYAEYLRNQKGEEFCLVLLDGRQVPIESLNDAERATLETKGQFRVMTYQSEFKVFLRRCRQECNAEKLRWFLIDFEAFVDQRFTSISME
jgi:hypothetical protein